MITVFIVMITACLLFCYFRIQILEKRLMDTRKHVFDQHSLIWQMKADISILSSLPTNKEEFENRLMQSGRFGTYGMPPMNIDRGKPECPENQ